MYDSPIRLNDSKQTPIQKPRLAAVEKWPRAKVGPERIAVSVQNHEGGVQVKDRHHPATGDSLGECARNGNTYSSSVSKCGCSWRTRLAVRGPQQAKQLKKHHRDVCRKFARRRISPVFVASASRRASTTSNVSCRTNGHGVAQKSWASTTSHGQA